MKSSIQPHCVAALFATAALLTPVLRAQSPAPAPSGQSNATASANAQRPQPAASATRQIELKVLRQHLESATAELLDMEKSLALESSSEQTNALKGRIGKMQAWRTEVEGRIAKLTPDSQDAASTPRPPITPGTVLEIPNACGKYDLEVLLQPMREVELGDPEPEGMPARITIHPKGEKSLFQELNLPNVIISEISHTYNAATADHPREGYYNVASYGFVFEDFNFDGTDDMAIWTGNEGGYSGPSYTFYLFDNKSGKFILNKKLSELTLGSLGLFEVNHAKKLLTVAAKSGTNLHTWEDYRMDGDQPVLVKSRNEEIHANGEITRTSRTYPKGDTDAPGNDDDDDDADTVESTGSAR